MMIIPEQNARREPSGSWVMHNGTPFYKISDAHLMPPFLMGMVSSSNHWMYIGSNGGLTAGRKNSDHALFPYYTSDKLLDTASLTGAFTAIRIPHEKGHLLWEPFSEGHQLVYGTRIHLYKNIPGNVLIFEAVNEQLQLAFRYSWSNTPRFGFVRQASIQNLGKEPVRLAILDGLRNILPAGLDEQLQNARSNLADAYKLSERVGESRLALYRLGSKIIDRPMPAAALRCNSCFTTLSGPAKLLLSDAQVHSFRQGMTLTEETLVRGEKGAYLLEQMLELPGGATSDWLMVCEVDQDHSALIALRENMQDPVLLEQDILDDIHKGTEALDAIVGAADGLQCGSDARNTARHYANVLYNVMRGGIFDEHYLIPTADFARHIRRSNRAVFAQQQKLLGSLPEKVHQEELLSFARHTGDPDFVRLTLDYLPLYFSRRHGDPSRPWNKFLIETGAPGSPAPIHYEGNWRDIFQNWEALLYSYPDFAPQVLSRFVNASTLDGYNPYKIGSFGIDWERTDPHDPWSFIGYWGDHQIIYLLKLLEAAQTFQPLVLQRMLNERIFAFANVPYRIRSYEAIVRNPKETIDFDEGLEQEIQERVAKMGNDGKLVLLPNGEILRVGFGEKLLLTLLTKLSNFVPDGGIWLNTQRPEWNDANNALAGNGLSMVTLSYLLRYVRFLKDLLAAREEGLELSEQLHAFFLDIQAVFRAFEGDLKTGFSPERRKAMTDALGKAGEVYRNRVYKLDAAPRFALLDRQACLDFCASCTAYIQTSIAHNRRPDKLYHAYNLMTYKPEGLWVGHLYEMLEGQVAVLSAGLLSPREVLTLLEAMKKSGLYRPDQHSYLLYPDRALPDFFAINTLPSGAVDASPLLTRLAAAGNRDIVAADSKGGYHFHADFKNAEDLSAALDQLAAQEEYVSLVHQEKAALLGLFEEMFQHHQFTGRSGTFFGYEGLGSIYWHMVSKLLLAVQEVFFAAVAENADPKLRKKLANCYFDIRAGLGWEKEPANYGAFPTDPYSHTPAQRGAQQPGMTGQVKEDILVRLRELGIWVEQGNLSFRPWLFRQEELLREPAVFDYVDLDHQRKSLSLEPGSFAFTWCQVPVVLKTAAESHIRVYRKAEAIEEVAGLEAGRKLSLELARRSGGIERIEVGVRWEDWV